MTNKRTGSVSEWHMEQVAKQRDAAHDRIEAAEAEVSRLKQELAEWQTACVKARDERDSLQHRLDGLKSQVSQLTGDFMAASSNHRAALVEIDRLKQESKPRTDPELHVGSREAYETGYLGHVDGLLHDRVHREDGPARAAKAVRAEHKPTSWLRESIDAAKASNPPVSQYAEREIAKIRGEPKPGDVLDGPAAKAWMLANPWRRVRRASDESIHADTYCAVNGAVHCCDSTGTIFISAIFGEIERYPEHRYIVLPPDHANPSDQVAELEGRVQRCEAAIRKLCGGGYVDECDRYMTANRALEGES